MQVKELMSRDVKTVGRNDPLSLAEDLMKSEQIRHLPVLEEGKLAGMLSSHDVLHAAFSKALGYGEKASHEFLASVRVKEVMTDDVVTISPTDSIQEAARRMLENKIGALPVVNDSGLVGLVTESDLLRVVAQF